MTLHDWLTVVFALAGFWGWFGVAHLTRLRWAAGLFYPLSMFFIALFFSTLVGNLAASRLHCDLIVMASAGTGVVYALTLVWYWRTHEEEPKKKKYETP